MLKRSRRGRERRVPLRKCWGYAFGAAAATEGVVDNFFLAIPWAFFLGLWWWVRGTQPEQPRGERAGT